MARKPLISIQMEPNKWYRLDSPETSECCECCECSLVHQTEYMLDKGRLFFRSKVDRRATKAKRAENGIVITRSAHG